MSPTASNAGAVNGNGAGVAANYMSPLPVGHQQDLNFLYGQIQELSEILRANREKVNVITRTAEEVAKRQNGAGDPAAVPEGDSVQDADSTLDLCIRPAVVQPLLDLLVLTLRLTQNHGSATLNETWPRRIISYPCTSTNRRRTQT